MTRDPALRRISMGDNLPGIGQYLRGVEPSDDQYPTLSI